MEHSHETDSDPFLEREAETETETATESPHLGQKPRDLFIMVKTKSLIHVEEQY